MTSRMFSMPVASITFAVKKKKTPKNISQSVNVIKGKRCTRTYQTLKAEPESRVWHSPKAAEVQIPFVRLGIQPHLD